MMNSVKNFLLKDNLFFGMTLAAVLSITVYALFSLASSVFIELFSHRFLRPQALIIVSAFLNLIPFRIYMINLKLEKTGRGILLMLFIYMILYFVFIHEL